MSENTLDFAKDYPAEGSLDPSHITRIRTVLGLETNNEVLAEGLDFKDNASIDGKITTAISDLQGEIYGPTSNADITLTGLDTALNAHITKTLDAHDASAISFSDFNFDEPHSVDNALVNLNNRISTASTNLDQLDKMLGRGEGSGQWEIDTKLEITSEYVELEKDFIKNTHIKNGEITNDKFQSNTITNKSIAPNTVRYNELDKDVSPSLVISLPESSLGINIFSPVINRIVNPFQYSFKITHIFVERPSNLSYTLELLRVYGDEPPHYITFDEDSGSDISSSDFIVPPNGMIQVTITIANAAWFSASFRTERVLS